MCVAALSLGLNLDVSFGRFSLLDVSDSGRPDAWTFSTRDPDAFDFDYFISLTTILSFVNIYFENFL